MMRKPLHILAAIAIAAITCLPAPAYGSEFTLNEDGSVVDNPNETRPRMPARHTSIEVCYDNGVLAFPAICEIADRAEMTVTAADGAILLSGAYSAAMLSEGIYLGSYSHFAITVTVPDGHSYTGHYCI